MIADYKNPDPATTASSIQFWRYKADVKNISNMYPYGKSYGTNAIYNAADDYRYGFNGMEKEKNMDASGDISDFGARVFDANFPVFLSPDPMEPKFGYQSTYVFAGNTPIQAIDKDGEHIWIYNNQKKTIAVLRLVNSTDIGHKYLKEFSGNDKHLIILTGNIEYIPKDENGSRDGYPANGITLSSNEIDNFVVDGKLNFDSYKSSENYEQYMVEKEFNSIGGMNLSELGISKDDKVGLIKLNDELQVRPKDIKNFFKDRGYMSVGDLEELSDIAFHETLHEVFASILGLTESPAQNHIRMGEVSGWDKTWNMITQSGNPYTSGKYLYEFEEQYESTSSVLKQMIIDDYQNAKNSPSPQKYDASEKEQ